MDVIEADPPILHIDIIHVLRQRTLVKSPINPRNAVGQYIVLV
jgi:hypothetical protein